MPVMKQLRIGSVNYDTVGEASVTQVLASGTKIATIAIDGTATDLYAPEGGSSVDPASAAPLMDGTAAAGTSTDYARADHVHPTDTSRAAASHTHAIADVTGLQTALDGKQPTLVSGTNIKTVNGSSLLGSGNITTPTYTLPAATTSTLGGVKVDGTTITANDGVISAVGGGGGVSYATQAVRIPVSEWSGTTATVSASVATTTNDVIVAPAPESVSAWASAGIYCSAQGSGTLTFACTTAPTVAVTANVMAFEGGEAVASSPTVTITLTNPQHSQDFNYVEVFECENGDAYDSSVSLMGDIMSPTGSQSYVMSKPYCIVSPGGSGNPSVGDSTCTCTGGASLFAVDGTVGIFLITSDGTITIDGLDYDG